MNKYMYILPLPRQHVRMLLTALFYGGVAKVTGHIKVIYCYVPPWILVSGYVCEMTTSQEGI